MGIIYVYIIIGIEIFSSVWFYFIKKKVYNGYFWGFGIVVVNVNVGVSWDFLFFIFILNYIVFF